MNAHSTLTLRIWPGTGEWTLYEDDGHTFGVPDWCLGNIPTVYVRMDNK